MIDVTPEHIERIIEGVWYPDIAEFYNFENENFIVWIFKKKRSSLCNQEMTKHI